MTGEEAWSSVFVGAHTAPGVGGMGAAGSISLVPAAGLPQLRNREENMTLLIQPVYGSPKALSSASQGQQETEFVGRIQSGERGSSTGAVCPRKTFHAWNCFVHGTRPGLRAWGVTVFSLAPWVLVLNAVYADRLPSRGRTGACGGAAATFCQTVERARLYTRVVGDAVILDSYHDSTPDVTLFSSTSSTETKQEAHRDDGAARVITPW